MSRMCSMKFLFLVIACVVLGAYVDSAPSQHQDEHRKEYDVVDKIIVGNEISKTEEVENEVKQLANKQSNDFTTKQTEYGDETQKIVNSGRQPETNLVNSKEKDKIGQLNKLEEEDVYERIFLDSDEEDEDEDEDEEEEEEREEYVYNDDEESEEYDYVSNEEY